MNAYLIAEMPIVVTTILGPWDEEEGDFEPNPLNNRNI